MAAPAWHHINKGMIDDSDVFSIIVDSSNSSVVFASACSGIYKSDNAGELFHKIQGIPFSARRTRVLKQDPMHPEIVYAGTTEGLWKTTDAGKTWKRVSNPEVVVNDVLVDPRNSQRVLLATDRGGVLASDDGAQSFMASNHGYTHRYVTAIVADKQDPDTMYVGVVNDREMGGVFSSHDAGQHWTQKSAGLDGRDVFTLQQAANGELVAGTNRGMFMLAHNATTWSPINTVTNEKASRAKKGAKDGSSFGADGARERDRNHAETLAGGDLGGIVHQFQSGQELERRAGHGQAGLRLGASRGRNAGGRDAQRSSDFDRQWQDLEAIESVPPT